MALFEKYASAGFVNLCRCTAVFNADINAARTVQVLTRFIETIDFEVQIAEIGFDIRKLRSMLRQLKVIASGSVFDQSAVDVITVTFDLSKILQSISESSEIAAF